MDTLLATLPFYGQQQQQSAAMWLAATLSPESLTPACADLWASCQAWLAQAVIQGDPYIPSCVMTKGWLLTQKFPTAFAPRAWLWLTADQYEIGFRSPKYLARVQEEKRILIQGDFDPKAIDATLTTIRKLREKDYHARQNFDVTGLATAFNLVTT